MKVLIRLYDQIPKEEKEEIIRNMYNQGLSLEKIAKELGTYKMRLSRDIKKYKWDIDIRSKAENQSMAMKNSGFHPTKGKKRTEEERLKISEGVAKSWKEIPESELERRKMIQKEIMESLPPEKRKEMQDRAFKKIREAAKKGSALEKFILRKISQMGIEPEFHKEQVLTSREKLQVDIFVPPSICIEIDGPSHFEPIWSKKQLKKQKKRDSEKNQLILNKGWTIIRVRQTKDLSQKFKRDLWELLSAKLEKEIEKCTNSLIYIKVKE